MNVYKEVKKYMDANPEVIQVERTPQGDYYYRIFVPHQVIENTLPKYKYCEYCGNPYRYQRKTSRFCSNNCRRLAHYYKTN